ncbi:MAG: T9SS type A sorting domain-containing protein [Paludibacteraceae bacterium]|nr:T9SS type A sorting domain-containing protein [Paludibacteraceae bacterium]
MFKHHIHWNKTFLYAFLWIATANCLSQNATVSGGGSFTFGSEGEFSFSVGQPIHQFKEEAQGSIYTGAQQPIIEEALPTKEGFLYKTESLTIQVGPNPTHGECKVSISDNNNYPYEITSMTGQTLKKGFVQDQSVISFGNQPAGEYLLKIRPSQEKPNIIVFKIAKI